MNITEHEMRGLLTGKCLPGDMRLNEELPAYLVRKFAELKAQRDALASENAALRKFGDTLNDMHNNLNGEGTGIQGRAEVACQQVALEAALEEFDAIQTPATDAYLNAVRADAVASFAHHQRVIADSETDPTIQRGHRITACRAEDFAAQLRAGEPS